MQFSEEFIKKLKEVYPHSIYLKLAKKGDYIELQKYLGENDDDVPSIDCEDIIEYINEGKIEELKKWAYDKIATDKKQAEVYIMFLDEVEAATGITFVE